MAARLAGQVAPDCIREREGEGGREKEGGGYTARWPNSILYHVAFVNVKGGTGSSQQNVRSSELKKEAHLFYGEWGKSVRLVKPDLRLRESATRRRIGNL